MLCWVAWRKGGSRPMDAGGLRTAVKPSRRTTDRGELHQPKKRGARQLAVPHTGAELVYGAAAKCSNRPGPHRSRTTVTNRLSSYATASSRLAEQFGTKNRRLLAFPSWERLVSRHGGQRRPGVVGSGLLGLTPT